MKRPVYLDYAATTPIDEQVIAEMVNCLPINGDFGNPASTTHVYGWRAEEIVEEARRKVAKLINADPRAIVWTSGATEANNLAIKGAAKFYQHLGKHIITSKTEHKSVLDTCAFLEKEGFKVTYLSPDKKGIISLVDLTSAITSETILVSIMHVNNETGVIQDIEAIGKILRERNIFFHVDAVQSVGKLSLDLSSLPVDLMSFSAHKLYGPKGIGALYVRRKPKMRLSPLIHGGGHENGMRSGTSATHQIAGMGKAYELAYEYMQKEVPYITRLRDNLISELKKLDGVHLNGDITNLAPHIVNISVEGVEGEALIMALDELAISTGSACNSSSIEPSHVLKAMDIGLELAHSSLRISIGRFTKEHDIEKAISEITRQVNRLRNLSPLWAMS